MCCTCFSEENNNILMWGHYADSHHGICMEFTGLKNTHDLKKMTYSKEYPKMSLSDFHLLGSNEFDKLANKLYLKKYEDWSYEKEYRLLEYGDNTLLVHWYQEMYENYPDYNPTIISRDLWEKGKNSLKNEKEKLEKESGQLKRYVDFLPEQLTGIILGCAMDENTKNEIKNFLKHINITKNLSIKLYQAREKECEYGLNIVPFSF